MPVMVELTVLDGAILLGLRVVALATFSLATAVLAGIVAWLVCCGFEAKHAGAEGESRWR